MLLVIGYGNELRRDDGVGPRIARAVSDWNVPDVRVLALHQLTPELADELARADVVLFIDAVANSSAVSVSVQPVPVEMGNSLGNHVSSPAALLNLAETLFGRRPIAWLLTLPARDLGFGEGLSAGAEDDVAVALQYIRLWLINQQTANP
jgi:hydrogenase maturation protease